MTTVFRVLNVSSDGKSSALLAAIQSTRATIPVDSLMDYRSVYERQPESFRRLPGSPFAYWVANSTLRLFGRAKTLESSGWLARQGLVTADDGRFLRCWWEVGSDATARSSAETEQGKSWVPLAKGGAESPFVADLDICINWRADGKELKAFVGAYRDVRGWGDHWTAQLHNHELYFRHGLTWPLRASAFAPQILPRGCIFSLRGQALFAPDEELMLALGITASRTFDYLCKLLLGRSEHPEFVVGVIRQIPVPPEILRLGAPLRSLARRAWSVKRSLEATKEASHAFYIPPALQAEGLDIGARMERWHQHFQKNGRELTNILTEIDELSFSLYGIDETDRRTIVGKLSEPASDTSGENKTFAADLVAWSIGVAFGRFDLRLATGECQPPPEPDPFDALPVCSPGMLTGEDGLPLDAPPPNYPIDFPKTGILVDEPGHADDLVDRARAVFGCVFGADADARWQEAAELLDERDLRDWFRRSFFDFHLKRYSKSRRKAPIYWPLSTASGTYTVWLYYPRLTRDTFFRVLQDHVTPKVKREENRLEQLLADGGNAASPAQLKTIGAQQVFVTELLAFEHELKTYIAPLWKPDLDDGVIINFAPLWRLVPHHKVWQKDLKATWDALCAAEYNWAHLAMHLWPDRVVPNCQIDRSLAIAHGLEDAFWVEGKDGKWTQRAVAPTTVQQLIAERTSPSVTRALEALRAAPAPTAARPTRAPTGTATPRAPRATPSASPDDAMQALRDALAQHPDGISKADLVTATGLADTKVTALLKALIDSGAATKTGAGRGTRYHPTSS